MNKFEPLTNYFTLVDAGEPTIVKYEPRPIFITKYGNITTAIKDIELIGHDDVTVHYEDGLYTFCTYEQFREGLRVYSLQPNI